MSKPGKEIGIFDAIYSLMEHEHRLQGAHLSGQRVRALQAGDAELFDKTTSEIGQTDAKLLFILNKRSAQAAEFEERGIQQPGLTMARQLHEYMQILSGDTPVSDPITVREEVAPKPVLDSPSTPTEVSATSSKAAVDGDSLVPSEGPEGKGGEPPAPDPIDPMDEFRDLITGEPDWEIPSRALTQKIANGRYPHGIRPSRIVLASVKYRRDLSRINSRGTAVQEAYSDGEYASISKKDRDNAVDAFFNDFIVRKGKKLEVLPQEAKDTIKRMKEDPLFGPLIRNKKGRERLQEYALYEKTLDQILLGDNYTPSEVDQPEDKVKHEYIVKMREFTALQDQVVQNYLTLVIEKGWQPDMRRAVALAQYGSVIPAPASIPEIDREKAITIKIGVVARERAKAEKKLLDAVELSDKGEKTPQSLDTLRTETARKLGIETVSLADIVELLNKRVTPEQLRQRSTVTLPKPTIKEDEGLKTKPSEDPKPNEDESHTAVEEQRHHEDLQEAEGVAFYSLLVFNSSGSDLEYPTIEEAIETIHHAELAAIGDEEARNAQMAILKQQFLSNFNKSLNRLEQARSKGIKEHQPHLDMAMSWLMDQELDSQTIYATRDISTLRRIGQRAVHPAQYAKRVKPQHNNRGSISQVTGPI